MKVMICDKGMRERGRGIYIYIYIYIYCYNDRCVYPFINVYLPTDCRDLDGFDDFCMCLGQLQALTVVFIRRAHKTEAVVYM